MSKSEDRADTPGTASLYIIVAVDDIGALTISNKALGLRV